MSEVKKYVTSPTVQSGGFGTRPYEKRGRVIVVKHPEHGTYTAKGVKDNLQAVIAAAREWKVQWSKIARKCTFEEAESRGINVDAEG